MNKTDLIIIGSGPGGYRTAEYAAHKGLEVVIVEADEVGGTCLNYGCIPTKTLCHHAKMVDMVKEAAESGIQVGDNVNIDYSKIFARKNEVIGQLRQGVEALLSHPKIHLVRGYGELVASNQVKVGEELYQADHIIIATGSQSKQLPTISHDIPHVIDSTGLLNLTEIPKRLCIVGAGVIGMEFASIFNSFGTEVTVIEFLKECLPALDSELTKRLRKQLEKKGINFIMQTAVEGVTQTDDGLMVSYQKKGKADTLVTDYVLVAAGRKPNVENIGLETLGIAYNLKTGIETNEYFQTNVPNVYAIGDVNGKSMLAHSASFQGLSVINHILRIDEKINFDVIPAAVFTHPEIAAVGKTEDLCKSEGIEYKSLKANFRSNGRALAYNEAEGMAKILIDADRKMIGCTIYGPVASELIQEVSSLMSIGATIDQLRLAVHGHPTFGELINEMLWNQ